MSIEKMYSTQKTVARVLLLVLPTVATGAYMLWHLNNYYAVLSNEWPSETGYLALGLVAGCIFYSFRFRFLPTTLPLLLLGVVAARIVNHLFTGEFTAFYAITKFYIFSILFFAGWLAGWAFARLRWFPVVLSVLLLLLQIVVVSNRTEITARSLMIAFVPVLLFAFYIIYTAELVRNMNDDEPRFTWFLLRKLAGFCIASGILLWLLFAFYRKNFQALEAQYGGGKGQQQAPNKESLTRKNSDGTVSNRKEMGLSGGRSNSKQLVFVAKLDHYFPGTEVPNPLYFTYDYYTRFDTLTQTLETDSLMPSNDLFQPDPSRIPLYFTDIDSGVIRNAKGDRLREVVSTDVYKVALSPKEFLAPSTAFFCQPIAVDREYQQQFKSAYRAKMYVSELNSAYFVYNPAGNPVLEKFQDQRFAALRKITGWQGEPSRFMDYYTFVPQGGDFDSIRALARQITRNALTPIDKIIAIRDYFLSTDETGQPLFTYTDNPGIPGLPSASKLNYFLFQNRKGYCAYFAGATMFLLRSLGIPSRVATGFLTIDRSTKNKGWYWFYEDQAHAWTQVYFPGYGWLDFDTTIPSTDQQQSPAPDGTPPITGQTALFVAFGKVLSTDTVKKKVVMKVSRMIYHDRTFELAEPEPLEMDVSIATILKDTGQVPLSALKEGMPVTALSFSEQFKDLHVRDSTDEREIFRAVPRPAPIDEIKIVDSTAEKKQATKASAKQPSMVHPLPWILGAALLALLILLGGPLVIFLWLHIRANAATNPRRKAYRSYLAAAFYLNQLGYDRGAASPGHFAKEKIDATFSTGYAPFMQVYLKVKYAAEALTPGEEKTIAGFYRPFHRRIRQAIPLGKRVSAFLNFNRTIRFFSKTKT